MEWGGVYILTNNERAIRESLDRIGFQEIGVIEIPFDLNVPKGIPFYSAHFKIDAFRYLGSRPPEEYSILLDTDIVCIRNFNREFYAIVEEGLPMVYYLNGYGGNKKLQDVQRIVPDVAWLPWAGGEFLGGRADFFALLYDEIVSFKEEYWKVVHSGLFHVGDEMLTSIALQKLRSKGVCPLDAKLFDVVYRYWSCIERKGLMQIPAALMHLPGDKLFFKYVNLSGVNLRQLLRGYAFFHAFQRLKRFIRDYLFFI